eukprot:gene10597-23637_t
MAAAARGRALKALVSAASSALRPIGRATRRGGELR